MIFILGKKKKKQPIVLKPETYENEKPTVEKLNLPFSSKNQSQFYENYKLLIKEWLNQEHIKMKTRLNKRQVKAITVLQGLADKFIIETLDDFLIEFRINKLSEDGESSKELVKIFQAIMPNIPEDTTMNKLSRFLE